MLRRRIRGEGRVLDKVASAQKGSREADGRAVECADEDLWVLVEGLCNLQVIRRDYPPTLVVSKPIQNTQSEARNSIQRRR